MYRRLGLVALTCASYALAQQQLGSVTGKVTDPQGALIPNASIQVTNLETNSVTKITSNDSGYFEANFLNPGPYNIAVEASGFKKALRQGLELQVGGRLSVDVELQIGSAAETVQVTAEAPLIDTTTASGGRVIDSRQIQQLPFSDMNPFALATLAAGMQWTGQPEYRRPFDNGGTSSFNTAGGVGSNEYTIDGAPVTGTGRRVGFVPSSESVEEFKLETSSFDASTGFSSGATINVSSKGGTNTYHGSLYDQHWQQRWNATPHFTRLAYEDQVRSGKLSADAQKQASGRSNNFGGTLGGPVKIPWLFNGKDKLFFFVNYNGIYQSKAETTDAINRTVPKTAWKSGDFSDLLAIDPVKYQIYDPRSARLENGRVIRQPFPGNKGIPVLNPMYKYYADLYPTPNNVPGLVSPEGINNYYAAAMPKNEKFNSLVNRIDYNVSQKHRLFGKWYWNHRLADEYDWTYQTARGMHSNGLTRINKGGGGDWIWTINQSNIADIGLSWTRFNEGSEQPARLKNKPTDVGLPAYLDARAGAYNVLPALDFQNMEDFGNSAYPGITSRGTTGEFKAQFTSILRSHSIKYGYNERRYQFTNSGPGITSGRFTFNNAYTKQADNTNTASNTGLEWAAFMMGLPSAIYIDTNDSGFWTTPYRALYVHDDWRVSNKWRLALGLRYEREGGTSERFNRGLGGGFDYNYKYPFSDAAKSLYAANPLPELPASQFNAIGGVQYLNSPNRTWTNGAHTFMPRIGVVYSYDQKTVFRMGFGTYYDVFNVNNDRPGQDGFSQGTSTTLSNDNGLTFCCGIGAVGNLSATNNASIDPFPVRANGTRFDEPYGNSLNALIRAGRGSVVRALDYVPASQQRWRIGVQRQIASNVVVEASYNGAYSKLPLMGDTGTLSRNQRVDYLPAQYWATGNTRNQALDDELNRNVPNPFNIKNMPDLQSKMEPAAYNYLLTQGFFTSTTIRKNQLLRAFPQMNGLYGVRPGVDADSLRGINIYHDVQFQAEKRFSKGLQTAVLYTWAKSSKSDFFLNEYDTVPAFQNNPDVRPHRFVWTAIYELPFGKGKPLASSGLMAGLFGGWQTSWVYQRQSGPSTAWGKVFFYGNQDNLDSLFAHDDVNGKDIHSWFNPALAYRGAGTSAIPADFQGFEGRSALQPGTYQARVFPTRLTSLREDGIRNWDVKIKRTFQIRERLRTSFDVDLLNATNHTNFAAPNTDPTSTNFGRVTAQRGLSRIIQLNLRIDF